ncbi:hypothetical protein [Mycolicibacter terrae]|jgi:hypothetical protein|nr:hypothetical protein [Mycolicibacter terrae]ORW88357.1 hypothetical protein AWC28_05945 [Mycolicibacter terrae]SNV70880.1 Uncharacterised protein [Mycolicibacter terrae]
MNNEIDDVRERIAVLLAELPGEAELAGLPAHSDLGDLQALARRLEEAHEVLVRALESVEKG